MTPHEKAVEAARLASIKEAGRIFDLPSLDLEEAGENYLPDQMTTAAITAYLASMEAQGWVMVPTPARDSAIEAACLAYWPSHWRNHMTDADKNSIREHMRSALNAAMLAAKEG